MYRNNIQYNKLYRNGILYDKAFCNGQQILGDGSTPPVDSSLLLDIPFNGDFENKVVGGIQMVVAGGAPTFANGTAVFDGNQSIKTVTPLDVGTDKVTLFMWLKTAQTSLGMITELSNNYNGSNAFCIYKNNDKIILSDHSVDYDFSETVLDQSLTFFAFVIDRSQQVNNQLKIFKNGILDSNNTYSTEINGNLSPDTLYIGQRAGGSIGYIGEIKKFQLYNRVLSDAEILAKYNQGH